MLSSVIPHAAALKRSFNHKANSTSSESSFTTLESLAESIEEAFERRLYSTNNSSRINVQDNNLFLLTTAIVLRYKLAQWFRFEIIIRLRQKLSIIWVKKTCLLNKLKKLKSCLGGTQTKEKYTHFARFVRRYLSAQPYSVYS